MNKPEFRPILRADVDSVVALLRAEFLSNLTVEHVTQLVLHDWPLERPNYGYMMVDNGRIVGCILAVYSEREIKGRAEWFCNLGTWYVEPAFRAYGIALTLEFRKQHRPTTYTALTPNPVSQASFRRFGYKTLADEYHVFMPGRRAPGSRMFGARVIGDPDAIEPELDAVDRRILRDHRPFGLGHFLLQARGEVGYTYVVTRRQQTRRLGGRAYLSEILYASNKQLAVRYFERLKLGIMLRDRSVAVAAERRLLGDDAPTGVAIPRPRFYRSETVDASEIDNLYSEIVLL
jgi:predicted N-acetyltransferase YhbS